MSKQACHVLNIGHNYFAFTSMSAAANALAAISKAIQVDRDYDNDHGLLFTPYSDKTHRSPCAIELTANCKLHTPPKTKPLALPAPKRNSVSCTVCENVSVVRGTACQSCGTVCH